MKILKFLKLDSYNYPLFEHLYKEKCQFSKMMLIIFTGFLLEQMGTSVNPTPATMGGTAPTWWGGSTAPAPPPTTDQSVNGEEKHTRTLGHLQRHRSSPQVGAYLKLVLRSGDTGK